jgi:hypothetical protein
MYLLIYIQESPAPSIIYGFVCHLLLRRIGIRVFLKHALPGPEVLLRQQRRDEPLQPLGSGTRAQERRVANSRARVTAGDAPASGREHAGPPREDVGVDLVEDRGVAGELAREGRVAADHAVPVVEREVVRVLHRRGVPGDEVQIAVDGGVAEPVGVAGHRVEVALWGRDEVGVVHEHGEGEREEAAGGDGEHPAEVDGAGARDDGGRGGGLHGSRTN